MPENNHVKSKLALAFNLRMLSLNVVCYLLLKKVNWPLIPAIKFKILSVINF